jgi:Flp pilus assembly protein TadG
VVEFALILPLLVALILFLVEFGLGMNQEIDATQIASQAARLAAVNSSFITSSGGMTNLVRQQADMKNLQNANVAVCSPDGPGPPATR